VGNKREVFHTLHSFLHRQKVENPLQIGGLTRFFEEGRKNPGFLVDS
jgi:hypothetical protein